MTAEKLRIIFLAIREACIIVANSIARAYELAEHIANKKPKI